jgi:nucleotide sugar dehydrogenase
MTPQPPHRHHRPRLRRPPPRRRIRQDPPVLGFDIKQSRIDELRSGHDSTREVEPGDLAAAAQLSYTANPDDLKSCNVFIVTVPTPVDQANRPDLTPLVKASETVGKVMPKGAIVIYESTVYPGATEEVCVPILEKYSGLKFNQDFFAGYSPERINPGDKQHRLPTIKKVTSGSTPEIADFVDALYRRVVTAGTHKASSIKVAEAAKVIENTQRDLNIALMNELALIFNRLGIDTLDVLEAAGTKWNFLPFRPGLVGGHCIGVDPYYLTHKAQEIGYHAEVILAGRRINDGMGSYVAGLVVKLMLKKAINVVVCVDNFFTGTKATSSTCSTTRCFELMRHDVTFPLYVEVDEIYNLACPASPIHYQFDPVQTTKTSVHGAINMLGLAKRVKAKILQASTSEVYGDPQVHPQPEDYWGNVNPIGPRSCYDEGKRCAETLFFDYHRQHGCASRWRASSTPTARACTPTTAAWSPTSSCRRCAASPSRSTATAADPLLLLCGRPGRGPHPPDGIPRRLYWPGQSG